MDKTDRNFYLAKGQENVEIRQYMSLDNLIAQLASGNYYVKKKKRFEDANEASMPMHLCFLPTVANKPLCDADWQRDAEQKEKYETYKNLSEHYVSCWTKETKENILMWRCYAPKHGVCIKSTINNFIASFDSEAFNRYETYCAPITYKKFDYTDGPFDALFMKDPVYESESEIRFVFIPKDIDGDAVSRNERIYLTVNHDVMIDEVILSPYLSPITAEALKSYLKKQFSIKEVTHSRIKLNK